jgi:hypothetical protein
MAPKVGLPLPHRSPLQTAFSFPNSSNPKSSPQHTANSPQITTLLLDCDNTLVLSESLAFEACAELANEILASRNIPDRYTGPQLLSEFVGQNFRGMMVSLKAKFKYEMGDDELEKYVSSEEDKVIAKLKAAHASAWILFWRSWTKMETTRWLLCPARR